MTRSPNTSASWAAIRQRLETYGPTALLDLLWQVYERSPENQTLLALQVLGSEVNNEALDQYRQRIIAAFYPTGYETYALPLNLPAVRQAIQTYQQTTTDLLGTLDLRLTFVETGTRFTNDFGDIDEDFYIALEEELATLVDQLQTPAGQPLYPRFRERIRHLVSQTAPIGWGYADTVADLVTDLWATLDDLPGDDA